MYRAPYTMFFNLDLISLDLELQCKHSNLCSDESNELKHFLAVAFINPREQNKNASVMWKGKCCVWWVSTHSLTIHQYKLEGSVSLSPFTLKEDICSLLVSDGSSSLVSVRQKYTPFMRTAPLGETKCNLIRRAIGHREAPAGLSRTAVLVMSHNTSPAVSVSLWLQTRLPKLWPLT